MYPNAPESYSRFDTFPNFGSFLSGEQKRDCKDLSPVDLANIDIDHLGHMQQPQYISSINTLFPNEQKTKSVSFKSFKEDDTLTKHLMALDLHLNDLDTELNYFKYDKPDYSLSGNVSMTPNPRCKALSPRPQRPISRNKPLKVTMPDGKKALLYQLDDDQDSHFEQSPLGQDSQQYVGQVFSLAQEQAGCRLLQQMLEQDPQKHFAPIVQELMSMSSLEALICHPFGNYLFQKLTVVASTETRKQMLYATQSTLVSSSLNLHGTRSVQKFIELGNTEEELRVLEKEFSQPGVIRKLAMDTNGNHVVQRLLETNSKVNGRYAFVFKQCINDALTITKHRHGCCVYQRCIKAAHYDRIILGKLLEKITANAIRLMQDPFANYVVQYALEFPEVRLAIGRAVKGKVCELACHKFSSNVIEKLVEYDELLINEIIESVKPMLRDQYANYVLQKCVQVGPSALVNKLVSRLKIDMPELGQYNPSCAKRISGKVVRRFPELRKDQIFSAFA
eukprot:augustus_masked-scaffold_1-processed-gene-5.44-mRNA-1 protein AED:1.00 eAED:1.00 QI:0/-1/0/0/-1/1/1/0/505